MMRVPGYEQLASVLQDAYDQCAQGKGAERHARGNPFHEQHMQTISRLFGTDKGMAFQVVKKLTEGLDMPDHDRRERELLGVIVYTAGIILYHRNAQHAECEGSQLAFLDQQEARLFHAAMLAQEAPRVDVAAVPKFCPECGIEKNGDANLHWNFCPLTTAPAGFEEEAEAAFAEAVQVAEEEHFMSDWPAPEVALPVTPSDDFDEARVDRVASSHGDGEHYAETEQRMPDATEPEDWLPGDFVTRAAGPGVYVNKNFTKGNLYVVGSHSPVGSRYVGLVEDDKGNRAKAPRSHFTWHSRP